MEVVVGWWVGGVIGGQGALALYSQLRRLLNSRRGRGHRCNKEERRSSVNRVSVGRPRQRYDSAERTAGNRNEEVGIQEVT